MEPNSGRRTQEQIPKKHTRREKEEHTKSNTTDTHSGSFMKRELLNPQAHEPRSSMHACVLLFSFPLDQIHVIWLGKQWLLHGHNINTLVAFSRSSRVASSMPWQGAPTMSSRTLSRVPLPPKCGISPMRDRNGVSGVTDHRIRGISCGLGAVLSQSRLCRRGSVWSASTRASWASAAACTPAHGGRMLAYSPAKSTLSWTRKATAPTQPWNPNSVERNSKS